MIETVSTASWRPHKPDTWKHKYATLKEPVLMQYYLGSWEKGSPLMRKVECPAGTRVRIVMVSRLGYLGVTENLNNDQYYGACVRPDDLTDWDEERRDMNS